MHGTMRRGSTLVSVCLVACAATGRLLAQDECVGYVEQTVVAGGTNGLEALHAEDLDGDGDLDLLTASYGDGRVFWYENRPGAERFSPREISDSQPGASSVFAADIDGDGNMDVLSAARTTGRVVWFHSYHEPGTPPVFQERLVTSGVAVPLAVYAADLDGDDDVDVLSAGFDDDTIAWYESDGGSPPGFTAHDILTTADGAASVVAADVDGDGDVDVLSASRLDGAIRWYENDGATDPAFTARLIAIAPGATSVIAVDLDGDLDTDVASASLGDDTIAWYENQGGVPPMFVRYLVSVGAVAPVRVVAADMNGDGRRDLVSASRGDGTVSVHTNLGGTPPTFATDVVSTSAASAQSVYAADLDGDGDADIASTASVPGFPATHDEIAWYENDGTPSDGFLKDSILRSADGAIAAAAADFDEDGDTDVASAGRSDKVAWYRNDGGPGPIFVERDVSTAVGGASAIVAVDFDGDLHTDLVSAGAASGTVAWHKNDGTGQFTDQPISSQEGSVRAIHVVDLDLDGDLDVLTALPDSDTVAWLENDGPGLSTFTRSIVVADAEGASSVHAGDLDGDLDLDVVVASADDDTVAWFERGPGSPPAFLRHDVTTAAIGASAVLAVDLDEDGDVDIVAGSAGDNTLAFWVNDGASPPAFTRRIITQLVAGISSVRAADLDLDGDLDLVAPAPGSSSLFWFESDGATPPLFTPILVSVSGDELTSVAIADVDGDALHRPDLVAGQRLEVTWFRSTTEICPTFDASGDGRIDGVELAWLGRAFGLDSLAPSGEWWFAIDLDRNGIVDGDDLSILGTPGVFGADVTECVYVCGQ